MNKKSIFFILFLFGLITSINCQNKKGRIILKIVDSLKSPIPEAAIYLDKVLYHKKTNASGKVIIKYKKAPKIITIYVPDTKLKEIIYSGEKKLTVKYNIIVKEKKKKIYRNIFDYLRAEVSGITISSNNRISVRGAGTFNGSYQPIFILNDRTVNSIQDLNPSNIISVRVLKGSEASVFGARGEYGVIIIKTK